MRGLGEKGSGFPLYLCLLETERRAREEFRKVLPKGSELKLMSMQMDHMVQSLQRPNSQGILGFP